MQLAYGKFDPDINPPPFSDWSKSFGAVEIDLIQYSGWKPRFKSYFQNWVARKEITIIPRLSIRTQRETDFYAEIIQDWHSLYSEQTSFLMVSSGRKFWNQALTEKEHLKLPMNQQYFFEWGQDDEPLTTAFLEKLPIFKGLVLDPDVHQRYLQKIHVPLQFKLHGWHDARWVRRYGKGGVAKIQRTLQKHAHANLILSYSGKVEEAPLFSELLNRSDHQEHRVN